MTYTILIFFQFYKLSIENQVFFSYFIWKSDTLKTHDLQFINLIILIHT